MALVEASGCPWAKLRSLYNMYNQCDEKRELSHGQRASSDAHRIATRDEGDFEAGVTPSSVANFKAPMLLSVTIAEH